MSAPTVRPRHRTDGLEIRPVPDGYIVHDAARNRVHYLNHTAALVLELCSGEHDVAEVAGLIQRAYDLPAPPAADVGACIELLRGEGLVV